MKILFPFPFTSLIFILLTNVISLDAQRNLGGQDYKITFTGQVLEGTSKLPMEYATISIFNEKDTSLTGGGITDIDGKFSVESTPGKLFIKVEYLSFSTKTLSSIILEEGKREYDLGIIELYEDGVALAEVEVTAERSQTQFSLDKRIYNVGQDASTRGATAVDILDNVPSVAVDVEGNVSLRGSGGVRILIDGNPSGLVGISDSDGLRSIPAEMIERIEVITNPSSRYEAEGSSGIINIVLKKERRAGFNGTVDITSGDPYKLGFSTNLNYRVGKINLFANYAIRDDRSFGFGETYKELYMQDENIVSFERRDFERNNFSNTFRAGMGYNLDPKTTLTFSGLIRVNDGEDFGSVTYEDYFLSPGTPIIRDELTGNNIILRNDVSLEDRKTYEFNLNFDRNIGEGHTLKSSLIFRRQDEAESSILSEAETDPSLVPIGIPYLNQRTGNEELEGNLIFTLDYVKPVGNSGVFEAGLRNSFRRLGNDYIVEELDGEVWNPLLMFTNDFNFKEDIHAAYFIYGNKLEKWSYQLGMRAEYSIITTELLQTNEINDRDYANLFPSAYLNYSLNEADGLQLSYSRRISRPRDRSLNPFFSFTDARNFYAGNPNLDPEFSDNYELGYIKYWDKANLTSSVYYRRVTGVTERLRLLSDDGITFITTPQNLSTRNDYGFEFVGSINPVKWWRLDGNLNIFRSVTSGEFEGQRFDADTYAWFTRTTSRFRFDRGTDLQLRYNYFGGRVTTQGRAGGIGSFDVAFSKDLLRDKLTFTFNVRDVFNTRRRQAETFGDNFYTDGFFQWRVRDISATISYRINVQNKRGEREGREDGENGGMDQDVGF